MRVTVVVPTYNEADNIERLCREVRRAAPEADILIVDDASPDGTAKLAEELNDELGRIKVIHGSGKTGLGAAYRAGLREAIDSGAEICVQMDADLSHDPAVLPALITNVEHGADLAIGSRYVPGGLTENWPRRRRCCRGGGIGTRPASSDWRSTTPPPVSGHTAATRSSA